MVPHRRLLLCAAAAVLPCAFAPALHAQSYPNRPIRLIVPYAPGGNADILGRTVGQRLAEVLGQQVIIDNRPGANSIIGTELAARAAPDGHTLLIVASAHAINPALVRKLPYDTLRDLAPVSLVGTTPLIFVAHPAMPVRDVKSLVAFARARPGQIHYGSSGNGSPANLAGLLLNHMTKLDLVHVAYKGTAQATTDVIAGHVPLAFPSMTSVLPHVRGGKLRALAMTAKDRSALAPDLPTMAESGVPGYEASIWNGMLAPGGTPAAIVERLSAEIVKINQSPQTRERYAALGADALASTPAQFDAHIRREMTKWDKVIRDSGFRVDLGK